MMLALILASFLFGSSLSVILAQIIVSEFGLNFFSSQFSYSIPAFSSQLALVKTHDILNFGLTIFLSFVIFSLNYLILKKEVVGKYTLANVAYFLFAFFLFLQTHFVRFSGKEALVYFIFIQILFLFINKTRKIKLHFGGWIVSANGFLAGFYLMLIIRFFANSFLINTGVILATIVLFSLLSSSRLDRVARSPGYLLFIFSILFPWNKLFLIILGTSIFLIIKINRFPELVLNKLPLIYALLFVIYLAYNPLFYYGNLDSVEEGFWLGWLERLLNGQTLYKDVAAFHPPLISWGMSLFAKLFGDSVYFVRLYLHVLKVLGILIFFALALKLLHKKLNLVMTMTLTIAYLSTLVKNNVEIRVGLGLLAILFLFNYLSKRTLIWLFFSGIFTAISFFTSIESGLAAFVTTFVGIALNRQSILDFTKKISIWFAGVSLVSVIIIGVLLFQNSLFDAISQLFFYAKAFSAGYFNNPVPTPQTQNMLQWWRVDRFLSSDIMIWKIGIFAISAVYMYLFIRFREGIFTLRDKLLLMLAVYSTVMSRVILGKSDWYHLLFLLIPVFLGLVYVIEEVEKMEKLKYLSVSFWIVFTLIFSREVFSQVFINDQVFKLTSYANISQRYNIYQTPRAKIAADIDAPVDATDNLIDYLNKNTSKNDRIFAFPWNPEIYFLADRQNATEFDTPYSFFTNEYQNQMIGELVANNPKYIIYNPDMNFANLSPGSLPKVQDYIVKNYETVETFGKEKVMVAK